MSQRIAAVAALVALSACGGPSERDLRAGPPVNRSVSISLDTLKSATETMSSDAFAGRAPGTEGETKTVAYLIERMKAIGLQPGNGTSWTQDVPLVEITADPRLTLSVTGGSTPLTFAQPTDVVLWSKRVQPKVAVENSEVVFVGYGVNAPELGWNDYAGADVKGKTVVILVNDPDWRTPTLDGPFGGRAMTYYGRWTYKYEEAARQGAAAAIIVHDTEPAAYPWGVVQNSNGGPKLEMDRADNGMGRAVVEGWITKDGATRLMAAGGQDLAKLSAAAAVKGFRAVATPLRASTAFSNTIRRSRSKNVVGVLPGTERPAEHVLYTAHWDHFGTCPADETGDTICNGAYDNATGTAGLLALAESFKAAGPAKRSISFLAVTAEEQGLLGSEYFAENPTVPLSRIVAGINMDGLNIIGRTADVVVIGAGKSELEPLLERAATAQSRVTAPEPSPQNGYFYRSDHFSLAKLGVPMLYAESGTDVRGKGKAWGQAKADDYTARCYHKPCDEYDANWDWSGAVEDLSLYYRIGRDLADGTAWPNWYPTAEFRAARDRSRAGK